MKTPFAVTRDASRLQYSQYYHLYSTHNDYVLECKSLPLPLRIDCVLQVAIKTMLKKYLFSDAEKASVEREIEIQQVCRRAPRSTFD